MKKLLHLLALAIIMMSCNSQDGLDNQGPDGIPPGEIPEEGYIYGEIYAYTSYFKPGATARIDGQGLLNQSITVGLRLQGKTSAAIQAPIIDRNESMLIFQIPANLPWGTYDVLLLGSTQGIICVGQVTLLPEIKGGPSAGTIAYTNISDAKTIYLTEKEGTTPKNYNTPDRQIFKITKNEKTEKIIFTDEKGDSIPGVNVHFFKDMSQKYLYMYYSCPLRYDTLLYSRDKGLIGDIKYIDIAQDETGTKAQEFWNKLRGDSDPNDKEEDPVLPETPTAKPDSLWYEFVVAETEKVQVIIQKTDNAIFKINLADIGTSQLISDITEFQVDYNENVYFTPSSRDGLFKIYTHGKEVYIKKVNNNEWVDDKDWIVDRRGNVIINSQYARLVSDEFTRVPEDAFKNRLLGFFINYQDSEGFLRLREEIGEWDYQDQEYRSELYIDCIAAQAPTMIMAEQKRLGKISAIGAQDQLNRYEYDPMRLQNPFGVYVYKDKTVISRISHKAGKSWIVTLNNKNDIQETLLPDQEYPQQIDFKYYGARFPCTEKFLYGMSSSEIWRLGIETGTPELLYKYDQEYDIKSINVKNGVVTFRAFELRRAMDVMGEIYPDKTVKIIESVNNDKIIYLERIN